MWLIAGLLCLTVTGAACAQSWEYDPYNVRVWLAAGESPAITSGLLAEVAAGLHEQQNITVSSAWRMEAVTAPPEIAGELFLTDFPPAFAKLKAADANVGGYDKLFALQIDSDAGGFVVKAREYDPRLRMWSLILERAIAQREQLPYTAWDVLRATFTPIIRVEKVDQKLIVGRLRAGGLIVDAGNPAALNPGDTLQPAVRRNDRSGEPMKGAGIQLAAWSVVLVKERTGGLVTGEMHSGIRFPIPSRGGVRMERLAVKIVPHFASTRLTFESRAADDKPLEGYDVYTKAPESTDAKLLGKTDWQGQFDVLPNESSLQILYVRSGGKLLARLPIVPGTVEVAEVRLADDQIRLQAEGIVAALQSRITDLVARREIYAARIRIGIKNKKYDDALQLVQEFRKLETYISLKNSIDQYRAAVQAPDKSTNARISKSFLEVNQLASRFLDAEMADKLEASIIADRDGPPPMPDPPPMPEPPPVTPPKPGSLAAARQGFQTKLIRQVSQNEPVAPPPENIFRVVKYDSPAGSLSAYITPNPGDGQKKPAIIWITGGDCDTIGDVWSPADPSNDQTAAVFRQNGLVMMFPSLRGGNDNPGKKEWFLGEVDDVIAAADYLAKQEYVDPTRIYLGGHSTGGTLALLVSECTDKFRAVFSLGPVSDVRGYGPEYSAADMNVAAEADIRSPGKWLDWVTRPTFVFEGTGEGNVADLRAMAAANKNPLLQFHAVDGKDHFTVIAPLNRLLATKVLADTGPSCNLTFTADEIRQAMGR